MLRQLTHRDSVAVTGSAIGLVSLLLGWLTVKPNRIAAGTSLSLWESIDWGGATAILIFWLICLTLSFIGQKKLPAIALGVTSNLVLIAGFLIAGLGASRLLQEVPPLSRISLGAGFWLNLAGAYIAIFGVRKTLHNSRIWLNLISWSWLAVFIVLLATGWFNDTSIIVEFSGRESRFLQELRQHIFLFGSSVAVGAILGILLGIWATRSKRAEKPIFFFTNITQTVPSLALFGLLIAPLSALSFAFPILREMGIRGVGPAPAIMALIIYCLLPIVRNTYIGLRQLDPAVIDAGLGMGMSRTQIFFRIEVPLAAPLVLEGVRTASVQSVGLTAVAALIGAGGLGWFIFQGLGQAAADLILLGTIPIIILAFVVDAVMRAVIKLATPKGLTGGSQ